MLLFLTIKVCLSQLPTTFPDLVLSHVKHSSGVTHTALEKESHFPAPRAPLVVLWAVPSSWTRASIASRINNYSLALVALPCNRKRVTSWGHSGALSLLGFYFFFCCEDQEWRYLSSFWSLLGQLFSFQKNWVSYHLNQGPAKESYLLLSASSSIVTLSSSSSEEEELSLALWNNQIILINPVPIECWLLVIFRMQI